MQEKILNYVCILLSEAPCFNRLPNSLKVERCLTGRVRMSSRTDKNVGEGKQENGTNISVKYLGVDAWLSHSINV